jgi:hypothetical protein
MWQAPDAEQFMIDYLEPLLGVPVGVKSAGSAAEFIKVIRTGGPRASPVSDRPQLSFEAYAVKGSRAWALAEKTRTAVLAMAGTVVQNTSVKDVTELGGPANFPDPLLPDRSRYTFTLAVHLRATRNS